MGLVFDNFINRLDQCIDSAAGDEVEKASRCQLMWTKRQLDLNLSKQLRKSLDSKVSLTVGDKKRRKSSARWENDLSGHISPGMDLETSPNKTKSLFVFNLDDEDENSDLEVDSKNVVVGLKKAPKRKNLDQIRAVFYGKHSPKI